MLGSGRLHGPYGCTLDHPYQIVRFETSLLPRSLETDNFLANIDDRDLRQSDVEK